MKRLILGLVTSIVFIAAQSLFAGPERIDAKESKMVQQPVVEPTCSWTGFYIGIHGGYAWGDLSFLELEEIDPPFKFDQNGFFGGGQIGFNYQLGSMFVVGVEGTFAGGDISDSTFIDTGDIDRAHVKNDWTGTAAARVGISFWKNRLLAYAKGGAAFAHFDYHIHQGEEEDNEFFDADHVRTAPLVGVGLEYAINCHWSVKVEYQHLFLGDENVTGVERSFEENEATSKDVTFRVDGDQDLVQGGINFKF